MIHERLVSSHCVYRVSTHPSMEEPDAFMVAEGAAVPRYRRSFTCGAECAQVDEGCLHPQPEPEKLFQRVAGFDPRPTRRDGCAQRRHGRTARA